MSEQAPHLRDQAAALVGELCALKNEVALAGDHELNVRLKELRRVVKSFRGEPADETAVERLKERIAEESRQILRSKPSRPAKSPSAGAAPGA